MKKLSCFAIAYLFGITPILASELNIGQGKLEMSDEGIVDKISYGDSGFQSIKSPYYFSYLENDNKRINSKKVSMDDGKLFVEFADGSKAMYQITQGNYVTYFKLAELDLKTSATLLSMAQVAYPSDGEVLGVLNAVKHDGKVLAVMGGTPDVMANSGGGQTTSLVRAGCSQVFVQEAKAKSGNFSAKLGATCNSVPAGWTMTEVPLKSELDCKDMRGLSAWVHGDGKGQQLKFQLTDSNGGARDYYVKIDFVGWKHITFDKLAYDSFKGSVATKLNIYYNGLPADSNVECLIDDISAVYNRDKNTTVSLEDFENSKSPWWNSGEKLLRADAKSEFGFNDLSFGIMLTDDNNLTSGIQEFERLAGIKAPYLKGEWNKTSFAAKESYLFLTQFGNDQFDEGLKIAKRGGFKRILFGQESWCEATGHFEIHKKRFPGGLPMLREMFDKFRAEGIDCGLHFLGASIYPPDKYLTPVPDSRLIKDATVKLSHATDSTTTTLFVDRLPEGFPEVDGGYDGHGTVVQIGNELITYGKVVRTEPYRFEDCVRGHLNTTVTDHAAGDSVSHLKREYGYHMYDMDSSLFDEVTSNFAKVVNSTKADMVYFDGSERLQGNHARYNAKLIKGYHDKFDNKNVLLQASSFSHYSWHLLARSASADGHGDLKGYLEERSPAFDNFKKIGMPLDIGWYYGYDTAATPDMYEYILGMSLGYDTSVSYQVSVDAAAKHPFTGEILDMISTYEKIRLDGRLPEQLRPLFRVPKELQGRAPEDKSRPTHLRKDYRLMKRKGKDVFQRMQYDNWLTYDAATSDTQWDTIVTTESAKMGYQLQLLKGKTGGKITKVTVEADGKRMIWNGELTNEQYLFCLPSEKVTVYGLPLKEGREEELRAGWIELKEGSHKIKVSVEGTGDFSYRVRSVMELPEYHEIP